jgi:hypothetical protein
MITETKTINRQARFDCRDNDWESFGEVGLLEAARELINEHRKLTGIELRECSIEVRDEAEPDTVYCFNFRRQVEYVCTNPRQGAD